MPPVNIHEAKTHLSRLVERAAAGEEIVIARSGKPVAKLVPYVEHHEPRKPGVLEGLFTVPDDFDDPLPPEIQAYFDGEIDDFTDEPIPPGMMDRPLQRPRDPVLSAAAGDHLVFLG